MSAMNTNDLKLSEKQQLVLSRYFDNESGFFERLLAKRLIALHPDARLFIDSLRDSAATHREIVNANAPSVDLWARIDARIDQEMKAAFYLGERRAQEPAPRFFDKLKPVPALVGGLSGAVVAATVLLVLYQPKEIVSFSSPQTALSGQAGAFQQVGLGNSERPGSVPRALSRQQRAALEVDWMRANGSLRLIPDADGSSAIIWVRRKRVASGSHQVSAQPQPTPFRRVEPSPIPTRAHQWLDGSRGSGAK